MSEIKSSNGYVLYAGPSEIDGAPIVVIATGLADGARNSKTGSMVQVYILRSDTDPLTAIQSGLDLSICGRCPHRGTLVVDPKTGELRNKGRSCYVTLFHGPRVVFQAFCKGSYPALTPAQARKVLKGHRIRLGAYGDPGAVPAEFWAETLAQAEVTLSYTHLWRDRPDLAAFSMASCDTEEERLVAKAMGFRTFRVRPRGAPTMKGEGQCPASAELGKATQCSRCQLCGGNATGAKADITIQAHGAGAMAYEQRAALIAA